jgi:hypothetical protein
MKMTSWDRKAQQQIKKNGDKRRIIDKNGMSPPEPPFNQWPSRSAILGNRTEVQSQLKARSMCRVAKKVPKWKKVLSSGCSTCYFNC